jgi:hypothetical protein
MALLRPVLIFTNYIFISTSEFLRTWSITIIILAKGFSGCVGVYLITTACNAGFTENSIVPLTC